MIQLNVPYFKQDTTFTCGPTVLQMVFAYNGVRVSEKELTEKLKTDADIGTQHHNIIELVNEYGFHCYVNDNTNIDEITYLLRLEIPPIVHYIEPEANDDHYAVVTGITGSNLIFNDPWHGEGFKMIETEFAERWTCNAVGDCNRWLLAVTKEPLSLGKQFHPHE